MRLLLRLCAFSLIAAFVVAAAGETRAQGSGLPLPRFVSLRADEVNMRTGPSVRYEVEWVYKRRNLPVEVIQEFETWRKVRDWQGTKGWVHQSMLTSARHLIVTGKLRTLRAAPDTRAAPVARLESGVVARLLECPEGLTWCRVEADGYEGWLRRQEFWGVSEDEVIR